MGKQAEINYLMIHYGNKGMRNMGTDPKAAAIRLLEEGFPIPKGNTLKDPEDGRTWWFRAEGKLFPNEDSDIPAWMRAIDIARRIQEDDFPEKPETYTDPLTAKYRVGDWEEIPVRDIQFDDKWVDAGFRHWYDKWSAPKVRWVNAFGEEFEGFRRDGQPLSRLIGLNEHTQYEEYGLPPFQIFRVWRALDFQPYDNLFAGLDYYVFMLLRGPHGSGPKIFWDFAHRKA